MSTNATATPTSAQPYALLTPDTVLNALESVGLRGDGRLIALNSYENRVYQVWLEEPEPCGVSVVAADDTQWQNVERI